MAEYRRKDRAAELPAPGLKSRGPDCPNSPQASRQNVSYQASRAVKTAKNRHKLVGF